MVSGLVGGGRRGGGGKSRTAAIASGPASIRTEPIARISFRSCRRGEGPIRGPRRAPGSGPGRTRTVGVGCRDRRVGTWIRTIGSAGPQCAASLSSSSGARSARRKTSRVWLWHTEESPRRPRSRVGRPVRVVGTGAFLIVELRSGRPPGGPSLTPSRRRYRTGVAANLNDRDGNAEIGNLGKKEGPRDLGECGAWAGWRTKNARPEVEGPGAGVGETRSGAGGRRPCAAEEPEETATADAGHAWSRSWTPPGTGC